MQGQRARKEKKKENLHSEGEKGTGRQVGKRKNNLFLDGAEMDVGP